MNFRHKIQKVEFRESGFIEYKTAIGPMEQNSFMFNSQPSRNRVGENSQTRLVKTRKNSKCATFDWLKTPMGHKMPQNDGYELN